MRIGIGDYAAWGLIRRVSAFEFTGEFTVRWLRKRNQHAGVVLQLRNLWWKWQSMILCTMPLACMSTRVARLCRSIHQCELADAIAKQQRHTQPAQAGWDYVTGSVGRSVISTGVQLCFVFNARKSCDRLKSAFSNEAQVIDTCHCTDAAVSTSQTKHDSIQCYQIVLVYM